jgi:hypothetical protein
MVVLNWLLMRANCPPFAVMPGGTVAGIPARTCTWPPWLGGSGGYSAGDRPVMP